MSEQQTPTEKTRRGIEVFRADAGEPLSETQMPMEGIDESVMAGFAKVMEATGGDPGGETVRCLFREPKEDGMSLCHAWFKSGFVLPRHSHNADCMYYIIAGELKLGNQTLGKGDGFFVPADAPYSYEAGPEGVEVLEFRNATQFNIEFKNNSESHWDRVAKSYGESAPRWAEETVPPSGKLVHL